MNSVIPSNNYESLENQNSLYNILECIYKQIDIIKNHSYFNSKNSNFELEFRLRKKYVNIDLKDFIDLNSCQYSEFSYNKNKTTRYRIICDSVYPYIKNGNENEDGNEDGNSNGNENEINITSENNLNEFQNVDLSKFFDYLKNNKDLEITNSLNNHVEYTKKLTLMTFIILYLKLVLILKFH